MKILIAEDQSLSRKMLEAMLADFGRIEAFANGVDALKAFETSLEKNEPFSMLIADIAMPEMDGIALLKAVRAFEAQKKILKEHRIKVLMFTSYADTESVVSCYLAGCDDYAIKPFNKNVIINKIKKFGFDLSVETPVQNEKSMGRMVSDAIEKFKQGKADLPSLPYIVQELHNLMKSQTASTSDMARLIENDTAISIKLLITANSPFYRGIERTRDVKSAINRLGLDTTRNIVSTIANKVLYISKNPAVKELMEKLWMHSFATANCAGEIGKKVFSVGYDGAYVKGLIHDVGATLLVRNVSESLSETDQIDIVELCGAVFEVHTSFGAALLKKWNFSSDFISVANLHEWERFDKWAEKDVLIVNLANILSHKIGYGFFNKELIDLAGIHSAEKLGLTESDLNQICEKASSKIDASAKSFAKI